MNLNQLSYVIAFLSFIATAMGLFSEQFRIITLVGGIAGLALTFLLLKFFNYIKQIQTNESRIMRAEQTVEKLKRELDFHKQMATINAELQFVKDMLKSRKGKADFNDMLSTAILIFFIVFLSIVILLSLGILKLP